MKLRSVVVSAVLIILLNGVGTCYAITIKGNFLGGTPPVKTFGGGNIQDIFRAAADTWEKAIPDDFTVTFDYGWGTEPGGYHYLLEQRGTPNRETRGLILVYPQYDQGGPDYLTVFLDPTPYEAEEFPFYEERRQDIGTGSINILRYYRDDRSGFFYVDLFNMLLHEIGHGLGMSIANTSFIEQSTDGYITIRPPFPYAGSAIPLSMNNAGVTGHIEIPGPVLSVLSETNIRLLPTDLDVLVLSQLSGFTKRYVSDCTIGTEPPGLVFFVDAKPYTATQVFPWPVGTEHTVFVSSVQQSSGTRFLFSGWSDSGDAGHKITVPAGQSTYTANFSAEYKLTPLASPPEGGSVSVSPVLTDGYYRTGSLVQITAVPNPGYHFSGWSGDPGGSVETQILTMSGPRSVTAIFVPDFFQGIIVGPGGASSAATQGAQRPIRTGYATIDVNSGIDPYGTAVFTLRQNGVTVSEVAVPVAPPTVRAAAFVEYRLEAAAVPGRDEAGTVEVNTGIALVNTGLDSAKINYVLHDLNGIQLASGTGTIAVGVHIAKFIDQFAEIASDFTLPADFPIATQFGSLEISSDNPLSILALRMTINQNGDALFTTTPVADLMKPAGFGPVYFPHLVDGSGYTMTFLLLNTSDQTESGTLQLLDSKGAPLVVRYAAGIPGSSFRYSIPRRGAFRVQTDGWAAELSSGWARIIPDSGNPVPTGSAIFGYNPWGILVSESVVPASLPTSLARVFFDLRNNHNTGLAFANTSASSSTIALRAFQMDGITAAGAGEQLLQLPANGHDARFADQFISGLPENFAGVLDIRSVDPFAVLALRSLINERDDFLMTTFPVADATRNAPSPIVFPHIVDGDGYSTEIILISPMGTVDATITFFDENGIPADF
jgi:hypothetical protein